MLLSLHVRNLSLIEEEEVEFTGGLNILTGETGAGKSIIIGSIGLALGAKADKSIIRDGKEDALIELLFKLDTQEQEEKLKEMDLPLEEDGTILIKRKISETRSTATVNGETVTAHELRKIASLLIDIYGQRENQTLLKRENQLRILDEYAGKSAEDLLLKVRQSYESLSRLRKEWDEKDLNESERKREAELLDFEINELTAAALVKGEDEELEKAYRKMSGAGRLTQMTGKVLSFTNGEDGAGDAVSRACRELMSAEGEDEELSELSKQLGAVEDLLSDFNRSMADYADSLTFDPEEFRKTEERLDLINHLKDKYGPTMEDLEKALTSRQERAEELLDYVNRRKILEVKLSEEKASFLSLCRELTEVRKKAAAGFETAMRKELLDLNFLQVAFKVELTENEEMAGSKGEDECTFLISMNPGEPPRPLDSIASGGELSRIMLALKTVFAGKDDIYTFIFDEIDTGISGQTAWKVSEKLGRLAKEHQILCITHLPQIASMGETHFVIAKDTKDGRTFTHIRRLEEEESLYELSRLLGGMEVTGAVLENAKEMKQKAKQARES